MARSFRKFKNKRKQASKNMLYFIFTSEYPSCPNQYGHYSGAGRIGVMLRRLGNRRHALRNRDKCRPGSIPPNPYDDYWTEGRIKSGWALLKTRQFFRF